MALRSVQRAPALSLGIAATLALGVGALTATFAVVNAAIFREPPLEEASRLVMLYLVRNPITEPSRQVGWSFARFQMLRESQHSFDRIASYSNPSLTLSGEDEAELVHAEVVSPSYFPLLGVRTERGRPLLDADDDVADPAPVALLSHSLWARRFGSDPSLIGRAIRVNGIPLTVVGILGQHFGGLSGRAEIWVPMTMAPRLYYADFVRSNQNFISVVGRLRPGTSLDQARSELGVLGATIDRALPSDPRQPQERVTATAVPINDARVDPTIRRSLMVLFTAVALLHLLACANVTNLLLGRAATRRREAAVRLALGSGAKRLFGQLLAEQLTFAAPGVTAGVLLAWWTSALLTLPHASGLGSLRGSLAAFDVPAFGMRELAFGGFLATVTAFLVALPGSLTAFRLDVPAEIKAGARGMSGGAFSLRRPTLRGVLVTLEAALAMLLVVTGGLLVDSFQRMRTTKLGVNTSDVLTFWVIPSEARVPRGAAAAYVSRLLEAMARVPGVVSASVDGGGPLTGAARSSLYMLGRPLPLAQDAPPILRHYVAPGHFRTLGIPLLRGRVFGPGDAAGAPKVTVISETAARRFFPNEDPIGKRVWFGGASGFGSPDSSAEIVGIVGDVVYEPLDREPNGASFYTPYTQFTYASRVIFLRTARDPLSIVPDVRKALWSVDPDVAMRDVRALEEAVNGSWARHRLEAFLFGGFGIAALLLAASGIFAVLAYAVASRTREFGIRIALGASAANVTRMVVSEGLVLPAAGLVIGLAASLAATRALRSSLYEVSPFEPRVFVGTLVLLLTAAVAACLVPARRATRADPMEAMRAE